MNRRSFRIRRCCGNGWEWECTLCRPPARGARHGADAWWEVVHWSLPRHMANRRFHHAFARSTR